MNLNESDIVLVTGPKDKRKLCIAHVIIPTQLSKETREGGNILLTKTKVKGTKFYKKKKKNYLSKTL